jgi:hypothetical protein
MAELSQLLGDVSRRFPQAFAPGSCLPAAAPFVALVGGLVTLADWLGSDPGLFPVAGPHLEAREVLRTGSAPTAIRSRGLGDEAIATGEFHNAFGFAPRGAQAEVDDAGLGRIALLEAETGSGRDFHRGRRAGVDSPVAVGAPAARSNARSVGSLGAERLSGQPTFETPPRFIAPAGSAAGRW